MPPGPQSPSVPFPHPPRPVTNSSILYPTCTELSGRLWTKGCVCRRKPRGATTLTVRRIVTRNWCGRHTEATTLPGTLGDVVQTPAWTGLSSPRGRGRGREAHRAGWDLKLRLTPKGLRLFLQLTRTSSEQNRLPRTRIGG